MRYLQFAAAGAYLVLAVSGVAAQQGTQAQEFTTMAANSDMFEIRSSQVALQKAQTPAVREFAQMMINDHTRASRELAAAAQQAGTSVPAEPDARRQGKLQALETGPAAQFDRNYVMAQVEAHQEALDLMSSYAAAGDSAPLKAHAAKTAPVIQMHLDQVQAMAKSMK